MVAAKRAKARVRRFSHIAGARSGIGANIGAIRAWQQPNVHRHV